MRARFRWLRALAGLVVADGLSQPSAVTVDGTGLSCFSSSAWVYRIAYEG